MGRNKRRVSVQKAHWISGLDRTGFCVVFLHDAMTDGQNEMAILALAHTGG